MKVRDYTFLGTTQSLCPECLTLIPAKIVVKRGRVYFRKHCPTHGPREDYVCSDAKAYDRMEYSLPGKMPALFGTDAEKGCPYDCGLCTEHEQHTCIGLVEITSSCNLECPMCYAMSGPGGQHLSFEDCKRSIDRLVEVEGRAEVLQLSGGEPTIHPEFVRILDYACTCEIDVVMINSNGLRFAHDPALVEAVARHRKKLEVYLQFDGFDERTSRVLRGEALVDVKLKAIEALGQAGVRVVLVTTLQPGINDHEVGAIVKFGIEKSWITGLSFQPATYSGRHVLPEELEKRITFPDVIRAISEQTGGMFRDSDFSPLPCAHPNCHSLTYVYRRDGKTLPLTRFIDIAKHPDLLANGITFTRPRVAALIQQYLGRLGCCADGACSTPSDEPMTSATLSLNLLSTAPAGMESLNDPLLHNFVTRALSETLEPRDVVRILITSFLDAYNFDVRRLMKCCVHNVLPSGHVIPFCAYNVLYRNGHVALPHLRNQSAKPMSLPMVEAMAAGGVRL